MVNPFEESAKYFDTPLQMAQYLNKYSRFDYSKGRRETWVETVDRVVNFLIELSENKLPESDYERIRQSILEMKAMPAMRLIATAGEVARRNNIAIFNCSAVGVDSIDAFIEALVISMNGCGVGYSVESRFVDQLPVVKVQNGKPSDLFVIPDTTEGWADALRYGLERWFNGDDIRFDYSLIRPFGAPLKIKGGTASGSGVLKELLDFTRKTVLNRQGEKLTSVDCHDIMCMVGTASVSGGVRRTALISLFDVNDPLMNTCKDDDVFHYEKTPKYDGSGIWTENLNAQRGVANNSGVWTRLLDQDEVNQYVDTMHASGRGEPGIFSRYAAQLSIPIRRKQHQWLTNPCAEILLRHMGFCNLSICVARPEDTQETLAAKVEIATIIGTIQSLATNYKGLRDGWKQNADDERLLGVDVTGQMDCSAFRNPDTMQYLKQVALETNKKYAALLGIHESAAITCVKPSGNSAILLNSGSGLHAWHSEYYIRNIRLGANDPVLKVLQAHGVKANPENGQTVENATTYVVGFPVKAPYGAITKDGRSALEQLEYWKMVKQNWCEHTASATITYKPDELDVIKQWIYENQTIITGLSFLPLYDANYPQMPYETCTKEQYEAALAAFPKQIDWSLLPQFEAGTDSTNAAQELACVSGLCEIF